MKKEICDWEIIVPNVEEIVGFIKEVTKGQNLKVIVERSEYRISLISKELYLALRCYRVNVLFVSGSSSDCIKSYLRSKLAVIIIV